MVTRTIPGRFGACGATAPALVDAAPKNIAPNSITPKNIAPNDIAADPRRTGANAAAASRERLRVADSVM